MNAAAANVTTYCVGCRDPVLPREGFRCASKPTHCLCSSCFASYVSMCCADLGSLPLRCFEPSCRAPVDFEAAVEVLDGPGSSLVGLLERSLLRCAAGAIEREARDDIVTCRHCPYFELRPAGSIESTRCRVLPALFPGERPLPAAAAAGDGAEGAGESVFECRGCGRCECLACGSETDPLPAEGAEGQHQPQHRRRHVCGVTREKLLLDAVIECLAQASARQCPSCGLRWAKDLACTHMRCPCSQRWCYHCGLAPEHESFNNHRCPLYLKYRFGDRPQPGAMRGGSPEVALRRFHTMLQREALEQLRARVADDDLWRRTLGASFPGGQPLNEADLAFLDGLFEEERLQREAAARAAAAFEAERAARALEVARREAAAREAAARLAEARVRAEHESAEAVEAARRRRLERRDGLRNYIRERREMLHHQN